jgi:uncharacterized YigZ family protein
MPGQNTTAKTVNHLFESLIEVKKSKFISYIFPFHSEESFKKQMDAIREEHPKGRHFVYAYRFLNEFEQTVENCSDDGEPKGSSGKPTLAVLRGQELINSAIIIVRYFGGIKLGIGGLVRAYGDCTNHTINMAAQQDIISNYIKLVDFEINVSYSNLAKVQHILNDHANTNIVDKIFNNDSVQVKIKAPECEVSNLSLRLLDYIL